MKLVLDDKTFRRILIVVAVVTVFILIVFRFRSAYKFPDTSASAAVSSQTDPTLQTTALNAYNNLQTCYDTFLATDQTVQANIDTKNACYRSNVQSYVNAMCPEATSGGTVRAANTSYQSAYTTDLSTIKNAYQGFIQNPTGTVAQNVTTSALTDARRADVIWATRKYIASSCTGFYVTSSGTGGAQSETDPGTSYKNWQRGSSALNNDTNAKYWSSARITAANISDWFIYAGNAPLDASGNVTDSTAILSGTGLTRACTSATDTNCSKAFFTSGVGGTPNWKIARENGPGTLGSGGTRPTWGTTFVAAPAVAAR